MCAGMEKVRAARARACAWFPAGPRSALRLVLYNEEFRRMVEKEAGEEGWDIGLIFSGGNTTIEAIVKMFGHVGGKEAAREEGVVGADGKKVAENVAG